jgi:hypothetical protein
MTFGVNVGRPEDWIAAAGSATRQAVRRIPGPVGANATTALSDGSGPEEWIRAAAGITKEREDRPGYFGSVGAPSSDLLHDWLPDWVPENLRQKAGMAVALDPTQSLPGLIQAAAVTGGVLSAGRQEVLRPAFGGTVGTINRFTNAINAARGGTYRNVEPDD